MKKALFIILILNLYIPSNKVFSQLLIYEDIVRGGVTGAGFSTGKGHVDTAQFNLYIEQGSTIKKAFLLTFSLRYPNEGEFFINNFPVKFNMSDRKTCFELIGSNHSNPICTYIKEVSNIIAPSDSIINIVIPSKPSHYPINQGYWTCFLIVIYENVGLAQTGVSILLNDKDLTGNIQYQTKISNPVNFNNDIGMSSYIDRTCVDETTINLLINNTNVGFLNRNDNININNDCSGAKGHFYFQNNQLFGLDDDIANDSVKGSDALLKINAYLNNQRDFSFATNHYRINPSIGNIPFNIAFFLAYSTPCEPFNGTLHSKDTTICYGESVRLLATGGQKYEWQPSTGLSCSECPAPFASPTESTTYTVRIWNNDSCNKVLPVRVNISQPIPDTITTKESICGEDNGIINIGEIAPWNLSEAPYTYTVNGENVQIQESEIRNLSPGYNELIITDANGCQFLDSIFIDEKNITASQISYINPEKGNAPLEVTIHAISSNNTNHENFVWLIDNDTVHSGSNRLVYTFSQAGEYVITLITYNQYPHCADTTSTTILVYPSFFANIPNVFSPNGDGVNDVFTIKVSNTQNITWQIKNRWGQIVSEGSQSLDDSTQNVTLWDGNNANDGVYFYVITATDFNGKVYDKQGNVSLFR